MSVKVYGPEDMERIASISTPSRVKGGRHYRREVQDPSYYTYGPSKGVQWVKDHAGPRPVTKPSGTTIDIYPALGYTQAQVVAAGTGATFWLMPGTHTWVKEITPLAGQSFVADPKTTTIDGGGARAGLWYSATNTGVTVRGGYWTNYGQPNPVGDTRSTNWHAPIHIGPDWVIEDAEVAYNLQTGVHTNVYVGAIVRYCSIHHNGRYGFSGQLAPVFEHNVVYSNNSVHYDTGDDAGGSKLLGTTAMKVNHNWFYENYGFDLWFDSNNKDGLVENNVFEKHYNGLANQAPFHWEISGSVAFRNNYIKVFDNAGIPDSAIRIPNAVPTRYTGASSMTVEVSNNYVDVASGGGFLMWCQANTDGTPRIDLPRNYYTHDNQFWLRGTSSGTIGGQNAATNYNPYDPALNNRWVNNHYHVTSLALNKWRWLTSSATPPYSQQDKSWAQWQSYGFDTTGTLELI